MQESTENVRHDRDMTEETGYARVLRIRFERYHLMRSHGLEADDCRVRSQNVRLFLNAMAKVGVDARATHPHLVRPARAPAGYGRRRCHRGESARRAWYADLRERFRLSWADAMWACSGRKRYEQSVARLEAGLPLRGEP